MKIRKMSIALLLILALAVTLVAVGCGQETSSTDGEQGSEPTNEPIVVKFSHVVVENTPKHQAAAKFKELLEERSNGAFEVQIFPSSQLYGEKEELEALLANNVQIIAPLATRLIGFSPSFQIGDLPFLFKDDDAVYNFFTGEYGEKMLSSLEDKGIVGLSWLLNANKQYANSKRLIKTPSDLEGLKLRTISGGLIEDTNSVLGAGSQTVAWGEIYQTLQNKTVDGLENTMNNFDTAKLYEVQPYITISNHGRMDYITLTNTKFWNSLTSEQQTLVKECMMEATDYAIELAKKADVESLAKIKASGKVEVYELSESERQAFIEKVQPVYEKYTDIIGKEYVEAARNAQ
jgi:C4-dicarboxylate-binding protein DctP